MARSQNELRIKDQTSDKGLRSRIYKQLLQINRWQGTQTTQCGKNRQKNGTRRLREDAEQNGKRALDKGPSSLAVRETQIKVTFPQAWTWCCLLPPALLTSLSQGWGAGTRDCGRLIAVNPLCLLQRWMERDEQTRPILTDFTRIAPWDTNGQNRMGKQARQRN